eukprot:828038-Rhodomonas_salina.1
MRRCPSRHSDGDMLSPNHGRSEHTGRRLTAKDAWTTSEHPDNCYGCVTFGCCCRTRTGLQADEDRAEFRGVPA